MGQASMLRRESELWGFPADPGALSYSAAHDDFIMSSDAVLTLAGRDVPVIQAAAGAGGPRPFHVRNAIPRPSATSRVHRSARTPVRFLFLGTTPLGKGLFYLLEAWRMADAPGVLTVAGPGRSPRLRAYIRRRWPHLPRFTYHPFLDPERAYADADALVLPTMAEGSPPRTVLEAASRGVPIITTDVGAEGFLASTQARIVSTGSTSELAERITEVAGSADLRARLSQGSRVAAEAATPERFVQDVVEGVVAALGIRRALDT